MAEFGEDSVYLRGVAEQAACAILFTQSTVRIPDALHRPISESVWVTKQHSHTLKQIDELAPRFAVPLDTRPSPEGSLSVKIAYPLSVGGRKKKGVESRLKFDEFVLENQAGQHIVVLDYVKLGEMLRAFDVEPSWKATIIVAHEI